MAGTIVERTSGTLNDGVLHNVCHYIDKTGTIIGRYEKLNLWHPEKDYLTPGRGKHVVFDTAYGRVGLAVCWDLAWPETFREMLVQGVDVVFGPTCWLGSDGADIGLAHDPRCEEKFLDSLIVARSFENECVVVLANCGGSKEDGWIGRSQVAVPFKGTVASAKTEAEELFFAEIDLNILNVGWFVTEFLLHLRLPCAISVCRTHEKCTEFAKT